MNNEKQISQINWTEQKNKLFKELYLPLFTDNGFRKRGWEFYKEIEKDKLAAVINLTSSGNNSFESASFWITIGIKYNPSFPQKLKRSDITLHKCEVQFNIIELLYPKENVKLGEYWYHLGWVYKDVEQKIGSKHVSESVFYGAGEGKELRIKERISANYIKHTTQKFNKKDKMTAQNEYVYLDTDERYNTCDIISIQQQLEKDIKIVLEFINKLCDMECFANTDTQEIIRNEIKNKISTARKGIKKK
jgi:hypothetical protein